jgi:death on curing protein
MTPEFLDAEDVLEIHELQIEELGGSPGVRDQGLLESALAQPQATAFGEFLHSDLVAMAAAYLYHIVRNHPFVDGNKRTGLVAAVAFLDLNDLAVTPDAPELYDLTMRVAEGVLSKEDLTVALRGLTQPKA